MRTSQERGTARAALIVVCAILVAACGGAQPSPPPVAVATPVVTPDPHLHEPATADQVFRALSAAGLLIVANNAVSGVSGAEPVKRINATYLGWPLNVAQYSSSAALSKVTTLWKDGEPPRGGEVPIAIVGLNILVTWGPTTGGTPKVPDARKVDALDPLLQILGGLLSPLRARAIIPLAIAGASATPSASPSVKPTPSKPAKTASPKPEKKASPKPSPKP
jgi:hypothetical protein